MGCDEVIDIAKKIIVGTTVGLIVVGVPAFAAWMFRMEQIGTQLLEQNKASIRRHENNEATLSDHEIRLRAIERSKPAQGVTSH